MPPVVGRDSWLGKAVAGRFAIVSTLAEGGGGRVYLAEQAIGTTKRPVALKMLLPEHASNPEMVQRFLRECETVSLIEHPNVVRIYDFGEAGPGVLYIAMELVRGSSLAGVLQGEGAFEPARALDVLAQICRGVAAAHDRGIVHRDLKPENLMLVRHLDEPELVKVVDFGIAKTLGTSPAACAALTRMGMVIGSPPYMSPEQFFGGDIEVRTDVYALGVVAYEMLTGALPFEAGDLHGWATQHAMAAPRPFDATPAGRRIGEPLRRAVLRALAKIPADRPATVRDFLRELTDASRPLAVIATQVAPSALQPPAIVVPSAPHRAPPAARAATIARSALVALVAVAAGSAMVVAAGRSLSHAAEPPPGLVAEGLTASPSATPPKNGSPEDVTVAKESPVVLAPPLAPVVPVAPVRPVPTPNFSSCERALQAVTCEQATTAVHTCPDAAGPIHHRAHERVSRLCGVHDHHDKETTSPDAGTVAAPARRGGVAVTFL